MSSAERSRGTLRSEHARRQPPASHGNRGSAMASGSSPPIMDSAILFERHSVEEVRQMERKTRQDIERKKEELRQMVGERYRDLIDAADTVGEMKQIAENVSKALGVMQTHCRQLKDLHLVKGAVRSDVDPSTRPLKERSEVYGMACQIRLLLGIPEMIWAALDSGAALEAAQLFLLARHVYTLLQLDPRVTGSGSGAASGSVFPLVSKQWTAISHFKGAILEMCRACLRATDATDQQIAESLSCVVLLEDKSTRQAFQEFLVARSYTVQQQPQQAGVKQQVCRVVTNVRTTVQQIFAVFCAPGAAGITSTQPGTTPSNDLLMATLTEVTSCSAGVLLANCIRCGDDHIALLKHLPKSVTDFKPTLLVPPASLSATYLQDNCSKWLDTCLHNLQTGVTGLLGYVGNASALAAVRDAVWDALSLTTPGAAVTQGGVQLVASSSWDVICSCLLGRTLDIWRDVLAQLFVNRSKDIIESQLAAIQRACEDNVQRALDVFADGKSDGSSSEGTASTAGNAMSTSRDAGWSTLFERDAQAFVWTEHASDIGANIAWTPAASQTFADGGGLKMKAHGLTPAAQSVAKLYDSQIDMLAKDVQCYTHRNASEGASTAAGRASDSSAPPYLQLDSAAVEACLSNACTDQAKKLISFVNAALEAQIELLQQRRQQQQQKEAGSVSATSDDGRRPDAVDRVLLLARLCSAFYWLCPNLKRCVTMAAGGSATSENAAPATSWTAGTAPSTKASGARLVTSSAAGPALAPHWADIVQLLRSVSDRAHSAWSDYVLDSLLHGLKASLLAQHSSDFSKRLHHITRWDEIDIEEESEEGREVRSTIVVPMQASPFIQELVYTFCREIGQAGGHNMRRHIVRRLISSLVSRLLRCYEAVQTASSRAPKKGGRHAAAEEHEQEGMEDEEGVLVTQSSALQCLFDVSFLKGLLLWKGEPAEIAALEKQFSSVVDFLQSKIDPFDLDVFTPHLQRHIHRQCQRSMVLLGTVSDAERLSSAGLSAAAATGSKGSAAGQQYPDAHNLLPLGGAALGAAGSSSLGRFPLLPVASNSAPATSLQQTMQQLPGRTVGAAAGPHTAATAAGASTRTAAGKSTSERSAKENHLPPALRHSATEPAFKLAAPSFYDKLGSMFGGGSGASSNAGSSGNGGTGKGS